MVRDDLIEALVIQCLKELANGEGGRILASRAADWFCDNVKDELNDQEWARLLRAFTESLKDRGALFGH